MQAFVVPQDCVVCGCRACTSDWSPLCGTCRSQLTEQRVRCCLSCGLPLGTLELAGTCRDCLRTDPGFDRAASAGLYRGSLKTVLRAYKFDGHRRLAGPLSELMAEVFLSELADEGWDCLTPVPSHPRRLRRRGFDSAATLCRQVALRTALPERRSVRRARRTRLQSGLSVRERAKNVRGAFEGTSCAGEGRVLIVDDILTSGATARELSRIIRRGGATRVGVLTAARTPGPGACHSVSDAMASSTQGSGAGNSGTWLE